MLPSVYLISPFAHLRMTIESNTAVLLDAIPPGVVLKVVVLAGLFHQLVWTAFYLCHSTGQFLHGCLESSLADDGCGTAVG